MTTILLAALLSARTAHATEPDDQATPTCPFGDIWLDTNDYTWEGGTLKVGDEPWDTSGRKGRARLARVTSACTGESVYDADGDPRAQKVVAPVLVEWLERRSEDINSWRSSYSAARATCRDDVSALTFAELEASVRSCSRVLADIEEIESDTRRLEVAGGQPRTSALLAKSRVSAGERREASAAERDARRAAIAAFESQSTTLGAVCTNTPADLSALRERREACASWRTLLSAPPRDAPAPMEEVARLERALGDDHDVEQRLVTALNEAATTAMARCADVSVASKDDLALQRAECDAAQDYVVRGVLTEPTWTAKVSAARSAIDTAEHALVEAEKRENLRIASEEAAKLRKIDARARQILPAATDSARSQIYDQLRSPSTARIQAELRDRDKFCYAYAVTVDAQNAFGAYLRHKYCVVVQIVDPWEAAERYRGEDLSESEATDLGSALGQSPDKTRAEFWKGCNAHDVLASVVCRK